MTTITISEDLWRGLINERLHNIDWEAQYIPKQVESINEYLDGMSNLTEHDREMIGIYVSSISGCQKTIVHQTEALRTIVKETLTTIDG